MPRSQALPKYIQIAEMLIREIAAGHRIEGERLPPEREMANTLGLSVGTLRKALAELEGRGLLERVQGSGNYIRAGREAAGVYALFRLERLAGGGLPTAEVLSVARLSKPDGVPAFGPSSDAHRIRRLRWLGGEPAAVEEIWLDGDRAERIEARALSESLYLFYRETLGFWIARAEDRISVGAAPGWVTEPFGPRAGDIVGYVERVAEDQDGQSVEFSRTWFDPRVARYVARLK